MKTKEEIYEMYQNLLKRYFYAYIKEKSTQEPWNCRFNLQHPLDIEPIIDGEPNPNYNRINRVRIEYQCVVDEDKDRVQFLINDSRIWIRKKHLIDFEESDSNIFYLVLSHAEKYDLHGFIKYTGLCKLSFEKNEITICDISSDADHCPAFLNKYSKGEIEDQFWKHVEKHHHDLSLLRSILNEKGKLPFWGRVKAFFSFKKRSKNENSK